MLWLIKLLVIFAIGMRGAEEVEGLPPRSIALTPSPDENDELDVKVGLNFSITCSLESFGEPPAVLKWTKNNIESIGDETIGANNTLYIHNVDKDIANSIFDCIAKNSQRELVKTFIINPLFPPESMTFTPTIISNKIEIKVGEPLTLTCRIESIGNPPCQMYLEVNGRKFKSIVHNSIKLYNPSVKERNYGEYTCTAINVIGNVSKSFTIIPLCTLKMTDASTSNVLRNQFTFSWQKPTPCIAPTQDLINYKVTLLNGTGTAISTLNTTETSHNFNGLTQSGEIFYAQVEAYNRNGYGSRRIIKVILKEPSEPTLTATGLDKSIRFNWLAPDSPNGVPLILRYYLCYKMTRQDQDSILSSDRKENCTVINKSSTSEYLMSGMGVYNAYEASIIAENSVGNSTIGAKSKVSFVETLPGVPSKVSLLNITATYNTITIEWNPVTNIYGVPVGYEVYVVGEFDATCKDIKEQRCVITVRPNLDYEFDVSYRNTKFASPSLSFTFTTPETGVPKPVLTTEIVNGSLRYVCSQVNLEGFQYEVTWLQTLEDGSFQEVQTKQLEGNVSYLETSARISLFSKKTQCKVRVWYNATPSFKTPYGKSNIIFNGISVQPSSASIKEGGNQKLTLHVQLTTPLVCKSNCSNCSIQVRFVSGNNLYFKPCLVILTNETRDANVTVTTSTDLVDNGETNIIVRPRIIAICTNKDWENHTMPFITIKRISVTGGRCSSTGDPHIRTFDGQYFDHYKPGYYTLVESTSRMFKVQVGTFKCGSVSCNCGVAVQEDDNILVIDTCRSNLLVQTYYLSHKEPDENTFIEKRSNTDLRMRFSSGAFVNFKLYRWGSSYYANLDVQVPPIDYNSTRGWCGLMDKNKDNDMRDINGTSYQHCDGIRGCAPFTESWKIAAEDSLFYYQSNKALSCRPKPKKAQNSSENCPVSPHVISTVSSGYKKVVSAAHLSCGNKKGDEIVSNENNATKPTDKTKIPIGNETIPSFPTKSGVTEIVAGQYCFFKIKDSKLYSVCKDSTVDGIFNVKQFIKQCITDIQILDDKVVALQSAMYGIRSQCEELLNRVNGSKTDEIENVCPSGERGECNLNGNCSRGVCKCKLGFGGDDCSNKPPVLGGSVSYCDVRKRDCYTDFLVKPIIFFTQLFCRTQVQKPVVKNFSMGREINRTEEGVFCPYPADNRVTLNSYSSEKKRTPYNRYDFYVSYDNINFSEKFDSIFVYDSKCISCTNGKCALKSATCNINGYCFTKGEADPEYQNCKICDPARSTSTFVYKQTMTQAGAMQCKERYTIECNELHVTGYWEKDMFQAHDIKMHLNDLVCQKFEQNSTHFWITAKFDECGSVHNDIKEIIIQENTAYIKITRRFQNLVEKYASYAYKMHCEFDRKLNASTQNYFNSSTLLNAGNFTKTAETDFNVSLAVYTSQSFLVKKDNPIVVTSYQPMFIGVKEENNNKNFKFVVNRCYAKPTGYGENFYYLFFHMKCPIDSSFEVLSKTDNHFNFQIEAFTFIKLQKSIFITCELFVCPVNATSPECTQECAKRKRRAVSAENPVEKIELTTDSISFEVMETCKEKICPENSKCLDLYPAECRCDDGYIYDTKQKICSKKKEILLVNELHFDMTFVNTYSNPKSIDFLNMVVKIEKEVLALLQKYNDNKIIGVKILKARKGSVILQVHLMYAENVTTNEAENAFKSALFNDTDKDKGRFLNKIKQNIKPSVTVMGETDIFIKDNNTSLILGILIPSVVVLAAIYGLLHHVHRRRMSTKNRTSEIGMDNTAIDGEVVVEQNEPEMG